MSILPVVAALFQSGPKWWTVVAIPTTDNVKKVIIHIMYFLSLIWNKVEWFWVLVCAPHICKDETVRPWWSQWHRATLWLTMVHTGHVDSETMNHMLIAFTVAVHITVPSTTIITMQNERIICWMRSVHPCGSICQLLIFVVQTLMWTVNQTCTFSLLPICNFSPATDKKRRRHWVITSSMLESKNVWFSILYNVASQQAYFLLFGLLICGSCALDISRNTGRQQ